MQGYDAEKALDYIRRAVNCKPFAALGPQIDGYLRQAQALDLQYMQESGVLDAEGFAGDADYDEDEALEYIVEEMVRVRGLDDDAAVLAAAVVDAYLTAQGTYLEREGLAD